MVLKAFLMMIIMRGREGGREGVRGHNNKPPADDIIIYWKSGTGLVSLEEFRAMVNKKQLINNQNSMEEPSTEGPDSIHQMK